MDAFYLQRGDSIDYTPATDIAAGSVVIEGDLIGVANIPIPAGTLGAINVVGVFDVVKGTAAFTLGAKVYWDATAGQAVTTATGTVLIGVAVREAVADDDTVRVRIG